MPPADSSRQISLICQLQGVLREDVASAVRRTLISIAKEVRASAGWLGWPRCSLPGGSRSPVAPDALLFSRRNDFDLLIQVLFPARSWHWREQSTGGQRRLPGGSGDKPVVFLTSVNAWPDSTRSTVEARCGSRSATC